jgi:hypothetical protein
VRSKQSYIQTSNVCAVKKIQQSLWVAEFDLIHLPARTTCWGNFCLFECCGWKRALCGQDLGGGPRKRFLLPNKTPAFRPGFCISYARERTCPSPRPSPRKRGEGAVIARSFCDEAIQFMLAVTSIWIVSWSLCPDSAKRRSGCSQ